MPIQCKICNREFSKQITNSHLVNHNITNKQYKEQFGPNSLLSDEYRESIRQRLCGNNNPNFGKKWTHEQRADMSSKKQGTPAWNKGVPANENTLQKIRNAVTAREEKYKNGTLSRGHNTVTLEQKHQASILQKQYALDHPEEIRRRAHKAVETKRQNGHDFAFFKGKTHTAESKKLIAEKSKMVNKMRSDAAAISREDKIKECNLTLLNSKQSIMYRLKCNNCNATFMFHHQVFTNSKFKKDICPTCFPRISSRSQAELEIFDYVKSICFDAIPNDRHVLNGKEIDIYIPSLNVAIEYNGLYWHSEQHLNEIGKSKTQDNEKRILLEGRQIRYVGIFEDEWINSPNIVKSKLLSILCQTSKKIFARKCVIKEIDSKTAAVFCKDNHIQGTGKSNIRVGLYYNEELVFVMTFSKSNLSRKINKWEINRCCSKLTFTVVGGASRLFNYFVKTYMPTEVISYADLRWSQGNLYTKLGFVFSHQSTPNYWYVLPNTLKRMHRFALRKTKHDDPRKTEKQIRSEQGYLRIWDCGSSVWIWKKGP